MPPLRLVMMGTGDFAEPTFRALYDTPHEVVALYTQPDRTGRGHHQSHVNRMKHLAEARRTPVFQPASVNAPDALAQLQALAGDVFVVAAYGQILSSALLGLPRLAAINVHASLLPRHRGAAPVNYAILEGDTETGVSIIRILPRLDAGPILAVARTLIAPHETAGELEDRLAQLAVPLIPPVLEQLLSGTLQALPQSEQLVTRAPKLTKDMGTIDWSRTAGQIDCLVRGLQPWPKAFTWVPTSGKGVLRVAVLKVRALAPEGSPVASGTILRADGRGLVVQTGSGPLEIVDLQPDGKRSMPSADFLRGNSLQPGDRLGIPAASAGPQS
ncbi:MAG: methionyl-tRNA formyltransferase [Planctomycetaceae bacterium]|nr:methionyl-tRNA formyltransferase [Planctomycetaceae bacterium]